MRKKIFTFLLALATSVGMSWATVITWNASKVSSMAMNVSSGSDSRTSDGITVTAVSTGEFVVFGDYGGAIEIGNGEGSGGGYLTFTSSVGNIAQIDINHSGAGEWRNANGDWISPYYQNFEGGIFTWSGTPAASVTLTGDAPRYIYDITSIEFTIEDGGGSEPATGLQVVEVTSDIYDGWNSNSNTFTVDALPGFQAVTFDEAKAWTEVPTSGTAVLVYRTNGDYARVIQFFDGDIMGDYDLETSFNQMYENITIFGNRIFYTAGGGSTPAPSETTVTWDLSDMASMGTQGGYFKAKGITLMAYGVDNGMTGDGIYGGAYFGGPFVFTTSLGKFTKIEVTNSYLYEQPAFSGDDWTLDGTNAVWEGTPAALVSLVSNFGGITQIKFTIDPNTSTPANSCGDGLTWAVNDGVLTISYDGVGTGSMDNYDDPLSMPWFGQNITSVVLPEGLISIGQNAFAFINTFSQITLPSTLQYILMNAFSGCGLTSVTIPANVKGISASAFISSSSLATVTFEPTTPPRVGGNAFEYCHNDLIIYYPCESRAQYYKDMQADIAYYHDKMYNCPAPPSNLHVTEIEPPASWSGKSTYLAVADMPGFEETDADLAETWEAPTNCNSVLIYHVVDQYGDDRMYYHYFYYGDFVESQDGMFPLGTVYSNATNNGLKTFYTSSGGGSTPANPVIKLNANFGGTYDFADTEAFTDNSDGTATLSNIALEAGYYYNFRVKVDGVSMSDNHEFTRQTPSCVISSGSGDVYYFQADVTGNYSFTWEYATNTLTIDYPASTPTPDPDPTPSATSGIFAYNYDCSRWPAYPTKNNSCQLSGFSAPCVGLNGIDCYVGNVSQGPWKVEFYEMYDDDHVSTYGSIYGVRADAYGILTEYYGSSAVPEYYTDQSAFAAYAHEKLPVYSLSQWNGNAYQVVGYGFICAYAGEGNVVEHAALFIEAGNDYGCFLSGHEHSGSLELTFDYDLKDDMTSFFADGGGSANPEIKLNANFGGTYDFADTEAFTDNGDGTATLSNIALEFGYYYNFRVKVDGVSMSDNHEFTRQTPSCVISSGSGDVYYFQADVAGEYSFTWEYATNTLTIGYPASTPAVDPAVQNVIDLINAIPNPVAYNQECFNAINAVYDAYVALSEEQRDQVTNYDDYLAAEERYYMLGSVNYVIETINAIGDVEFTPACKHRIDYARSEYCNLTLEAKGYVTNYNTLLAAEAAYAALIPVSSTVEWDEAILETIDADEWGEATYTNGSLSLKAVDGRARYVDDEEHFLFDGSNSEKSFVFSCTSANILCIEITVSEKHEHNELSCAWQETATGYRWVGEATSVDLASTIFKVTGIRFSLGEAFPEPTPTPAQDGDKLPGAFSVSGGTVVYFSKGNLQYLGNIDRWHFAENQWTIIGNAQASDNRDLFSWGTGDNPDSEDYSTYTEWGNNIEGNWRTLTVDEWTYLFNTRTDASSKYGTATVAGVVGLILLPDVYDGTAINTDRTAWDNNVISSSDWAAYEAAGAVFLPAAGLSDAFGVYGVGEQGFYWSSTMDALSHNAISVFYGFNYWEGFWFNQVDAQFQPQEGHSVRLVSETAPTPVGPTYLDADFAIDFRTDPYTKVGGGDLPAGVLVEGSMNTGDAQHGYRLPVITIPVTAGNYKVMMGTCSYSNQDATVKTEDGSHTYATLATNNGTCYHNNTTANVVGAIFNVPSDQIIKVYGAEYTPFFSIEKMAAVPAFTDFELNFQTNPYNEISGAKPEGTVIAGSFHDGQHGYQNVEATVPVKAGKYRLTLGACGYGNGAGNVMSETNVELASFNQKLAENDKCYHQDPANNIVSMIFDVDQDQTITIDCGQYTPYMKLEAVTAYQVSFALSDAEGSVPAAVDVTVGEGITMPVNKTMYKEGYTLTGWSDGVNTYPIGESFTPANDVVLTPVFTANEADLLNASTDVNVKWYFGGDNGAPVMHLEGSAGLLVAQATIGDKTVDVKLDIDATSGKFVPQPTTEWAQVRVGTIFTYPYKEGMTVDVHTYSGNVTYYIADGNVTCGTNDYYSFIEVTYPATAPAPAAVVIGDLNNVSEVETFLTTYDGQTIDELIIDRPVLNNMYNTLCLPFDMNAAQIAASSLNGVEIREFTGASVDGTTLNLSVGDPVNAVVAGRPYFVKYSAASQLEDLHFEDVTINNALLDNMAVTFDGVTFKGTFTPFVMPNGLNFNGGYLFLGQNNQLFWPNTSNPLKPFRAYFYVDVEASTPGNAPKYRGMPARIVEGKNVATGVENAQSANQSTKVIVNGQLIIIKNDVRYNAQGQIVK